MHPIDAILGLIAHHTTLAYIAVFLISLSESLALVGLVVPGTVIMFGVGAVVATGNLGLKPALLLAAAGAVVGDGISYWLGRHYQGERISEIRLSMFAEPVRSCLCCLASVATAPPVFGQPP